MRLDELADLNMGQSPAGESLNETNGIEFHQGKVFFGELSLGISPIKTSAPTKLAKPGDILICVRAPVGVVNITDREVCIGRGLAALTPKAGVPTRFLLHLLRYHQTDIEQIATGSTFASITTEQLRSVEFPVPNEDARLRIAGILGSIDEKIELNRRKIAELEALAKTIYNYWFVQFDFPDTNGRPYKSSGGKMVWNEQLKREVPEGWEIGNIFMVSDLKVGGTPSKKQTNYWNGDIPFWGPTDYTDNIFQFHTEERISHAGLEHCSSDYLTENTVIITARGSIGKVALTGKMMAMNQSCFAFDAHAHSYGFIYYLAKQMVEHLKTTSTGSVFNAFVTADMKNVILPLGIPPIRQRYTEVTTPVFESIKKCVMKNDELIAIRDALLPLLMNGQVEVAR